MGLSRPIDDDQLTLGKISYALHDYLFTGYLANLPQSDFARERQHEFKASKLLSEIRKIDNSPSPRVKSQLCDRISEAFDLAHQYKSASRAQSLRGAVVSSVKIASY